MGFSISLQLVPIRSPVCSSWMLCPAWVLFLPLPHISGWFLALSLALSSCCVSATIKIAEEALK